MPKGRPNIRPATVEDLNEKELRIFNMLSDDPQAQTDYLALIPGVKLGSVATKVDKTKALEIRLAATEEFVASYNEYLEKVRQAVNDNEEGKDVDLREVKKLPKIDGWVVSCGAGVKPRGTRIKKEKVSKNGNEEEATASDEEGTVIGGRRRKQAVSEDSNHGREIGNFLPAVV